MTTFPQGCSGITELLFWTSGHDGLCTRHTVRASPRTIEPSLAGRVNCPPICSMSGHVTLNRRRPGRRGRETGRRFLHLADVTYRSGRTTHTLPTWRGTASAVRPSPLA